MTEIFRQLFPIGTYWSWLTFFMYLFAAVLVTELCKIGAAYLSVPTRHSFNPNRLFYFMAFVILVLLASLRTSDVGRDTSVYVNYFQQAVTFNYDIRNFFTFSDTEPAYFLYIYLLRRFTDSYTVYFIITYMWVAGAYISFIRSNFDDKSDYIFLQIFIFYYVSNMSGARSGIATGFLLFSLTALKKKHFLRALLLTVIASTFHYTMLFNFFVIFIVWLFNKRKMINKKWILAAVAAVMIIIAKRDFTEFQNFLKDTKYEYYSSVNMDERSLLGSIFILTTFLFCFIYYKKFALSSRSKMALVPFLSTLSLAVVYPVIFITGAYRIPYYYVLPRLAAWSEIHRFNKERLSKMTRVLYMACEQFFVIMYLLFLFTRSSLDGNFEYHFIFG